MSPELRALLEPLAEMVADRVAARLASRSRDDELVTARSSGIGVRTFRRAARAKEFPVYLVGREWAAKRADVMAYVERCRVSFHEDKTPKAGAGDAFDLALAKGRLRAVGGRDAR